MSEPVYESGSFGEDSKEVLSEAYDGDSGAVITLISCPESAIGGSGPIFEVIDSKSVYVIVSEEFVEKIVNSASDENSRKIHYGMMMGDMMRRGSYYAQNINNTINNK
jgi:hypothetical protein